MKTSKYAPKTPAENLAQSRADKLKQDKEKTTRLLGRLRWKAELLMVSYFKALEILQTEMRHEGHGQEQREIEIGTQSKQAESMFKIDFFEFYTLLERFITDCLSMLGFSVSAAAPQSNFNALRYITNPDLHKLRPLASHAFHANLLEALDDEKCPLHESLGAQLVRIQLGLAKDYRNAWKDAGEKDSMTRWTSKDGDPRTNIKLHDFQLELMLRTLIAGCEEAHSVVQRHSPTPNGDGLTSRDFEPQTYGLSAMESDDAPFEYMDDAMDLD